jgi:hypothetical protein
MPESDESAAALLEEAREYSDRAQTSPAGVTSELPRLVELLERTGFEEDDVKLRDEVIEPIILAAEHSPTAVEDQYPEIVELLLDTAESRVLAARLLHGSVTHLRREIAASTLVDGYINGVQVGIETLDDLIDELDTDETLPGNGATALRIREEVDYAADAIGGRERLAVETLSAAFDELVCHYAREEGLDPVDALVDLRAEFEMTDSPFTQGFSSGTIEDAFDAGESEQVSYVKRYLLDAVAATCLVLYVEREPARILRTEAVITERTQ